MRTALVVAGVVLAILSAIMLFVPLVPQPNDTVSTNVPHRADVVSVSGFSLVGSIPVSITWTATAAVTVLAISCSSCPPTNANEVSGVVKQSGTSGMFSLSQPNGGEVVVDAWNTSGISANVTFKVSTASTVGSVLLTIGVLLLIIGLVLKSGKPAPTPAMAAAAPATGAPAPTSPIGPS